MASIGRNDPCPCGSGKKYKHCHWRIDQQLRRQNFQLERAWQTLGDRIWRFGVEDHFAPEILSAWELFWDNRVPPEAMANLDVTQRLRFMIWYIYDYRTKERKRIAELFLEEKAAELSPLEQDLIRDWVKSHVSVYEVVDHAEDGVRVRDVFTGANRTAQDTGTEGLRSTGQLMLARLLPLGSKLRMGPDVTEIPQTAKGELLESIVPRFKAWQQARYGADWADFLKEAGYLLNHFLIRNMKPMEPPASRQREMTPAQAARAIARRMQTEIITTSLDVHYERWMDNPIPEWGGKTPREMVQTPEGVQKVELLLDVLEEMEAERARSGQPAFDVSLLRRKLGLAGEVRTTSGLIVPG